MITPKRLLLLGLLLAGFTTHAQDNVSLRVDARTIDGRIDPLIYGQLFEHIYFSANNGVWQEIIYGRSFEPEHYPGIAPRDGYFDGWFADADEVLHSPTRYEQPIELVKLDTDSYDIEMDVKWRAYKLPGRRWSGGLLDLRFAVKDQADGEPYFLRLYDPAYEGQRFTLAQTEAQIEADRQAQALAQAQKQAVSAEFSLATRVEKEVPFFGGRTRKVVALESFATKGAKAEQIDQEAWHHVKVSCRGKNVTVWWDGRKILARSVPTSRRENTITLWENYTEALYRNIRITSGKQVLFAGMPEQVKVPDVAPEWTSFGDAAFTLVKGDAVNMDYAQQIAAKGVSGLQQGPQAVRPGDPFVGSVYAKGDGRARLSVGLRKGGEWIVRQDLGCPSPDWQKYEFTLDAGAYAGDADFAIAAEDGTLLIDQASMGTRAGQALGGFRPDIFQAVKDLHPTCLRWPGGGYAAQYDWKWGVGPQEERRRWDHWQWLDSEPVIVVSVGFERPESEYRQLLDNAVNWLRYCNEPATGEWGAKRAANGHPEPYNVKYWEIDNEMWEMGIERYERCVRDYSVALRAVDPSIKIIACGGFPEDEAFLNRSGRFFDYMSLHHYEQQGGYATGPARLAQQYRRYADMIAACPNPNIKLFISEWNLNSTDWRTGLFAGGFLNVCENMDVVAMGAAALFIRRTDAPDWNNAFINFDYQGLFVAPNYLVTELWENHYSPLRLAYEGDTKDLSVSATLAENAGSVIVKVVNPTDKPYTLTLNGNWGPLEGAQYEFYAPGELLAANTMENRNAVQLQQKQLPLDGESLTMTVDPLSAGVITLQRK
jgi:alpha-N-arabinofuranosidase